MVGALGKWVQSRLGQRNLAVLAGALLRVLLSLPLKANYTQEDRALNVSSQHGEVYTVLSDSKLASGTKKPPHSAHITEC